MDAGKIAVVVALGLVVRDNLRALGLHGHTVCHGAPTLVPYETQRDVLPVPMRARGQPLPRAEFDWARPHSRLPGELAVRGILSDATQCTPDSDVCVTMG